MSQTDTIVAQATAHGIASVGIIRVSGPNVPFVANSILGKQIADRLATYLPFFDKDKQVIDQGLAIYFKAPNSFTGEDVLELHAHGGPIVMQLLLQACLYQDKVRLAKPGEFSEQAFLNDKIDLAQAEAISDLISASSTQAAKSAIRSLQGSFSKLVNELIQQLISLRIYVEAAIDFPEEEIDFLKDQKIKTNLKSIISNITQIQQKAKQGSLLRDGMRIVIVGKPNAGKSSLLNALAEKQVAIVTEIPGTTRDTIKEFINIDGMPLHFIDTAGLRNTKDKIEKLGIELALEEIKQADRVLYVIDASEDSYTPPEKLFPEYQEILDDIGQMTIIRNKCDLTFEEIKEYNYQGITTINVSAKRGLGIDNVRNHLKHVMGFERTEEDLIIARTRHVEAISAALKHIENGLHYLETELAGEILAEELRIAQQRLSEITGEFTSDDLLGKIFSSFCIGK